MRDLFAQLFVPNAQGQTNAFGSNPNALSLAGLIAATGNKSLGDALPIAAQITHQQQLQMMQKQKLEQQQQQAMQTAKLLGEINPTLGALYGSDPRNAAVLFEAIKPNPLENTFKGAGGVLYQAGKNPKTGQIESNPIVGQQPDFQPLSSQEKRVQSIEKGDYAKRAAAGSKELRILKNIKEAFKKYDSETEKGGLKSGGFLSSTSKIPYLSEDQTNAALYNKNQLTYKNEIDKLNSQMAQARIAAAPAGAAKNVSFQDLVEKGLPRVSMTKEARETVILAKEKEAAQDIIRNKVFNEWEKLNNGDRTGAEDVMNYIDDNYEYTDKEGNLNKKLVSNLKEIVRQFQVGEVSTLNEKASNDLMNEDEFDNMLNDEGFLNYLQQGTR